MYGLDSVEELKLELSVNTQRSDETLFAVAVGELITGQDRGAGRKGMLLLPVEQLLLLDGVDYRNKFRSNLYRKLVHGPWTRVALCSWVQCFASSVPFLRADWFAGRMYADVSIASTQKV